MKRKVKVNTSTYGPLKLMIIIGMVVLGACAEHTREYSITQQHFEPQVRMTADLDMYESPSLETYQETHLFGNGLTSQKPVEGTIPRGYMPYPYPNDSTGYSMAGLEWINPYKGSEKELAKGQDLYTKFCMHCHGETGDADGSVIQNSKFPPPPSFLTGKSSRSVTNGAPDSLINLAEGKMYHTVTFGQNMMGSHASQLNMSERWLIIAYIKSLQGVSAVVEGNGAESTEAEEVTEAVAVAPVEVVTEEATEPVAEEDDTE